MASVENNPVYIDDTDSSIDLNMYNEDYNEETPILPVNENQHMQYEQRITWYVYFLAFFAAIGGFLFGYDTAVISGTMIPLKKEFSLSNELQELVVSITVGGAILGAISSGFLNSWFGRRIVLLVASFMLTVGAVLMSAASTVVLLLLGRFVVGLGIGYASSTVPIYIAEAAPAKIRGQLVMVNQLFLTFGQFIASVLNGAFSYIENNGWRYMLGVSGVPSFIMFVGLFFMPESPRWLIDKGVYH